MQYLVIERYRDPVAVYRRLREAGRQLPEGLSHVASWVTQDLSGCYQVMECQDRALLQCVDDSVGRPGGIRDRTCHQLC